MAALGQSASDSTSQKTGFAPASMIASALAQKLNGKQIPSEPGSTPIARNKIVFASMLLATPTACRTPR